MSWRAFSGPRSSTNNVPIVPGRRVLPTSTPFLGQNIFELYRREAEAAEQRRKPQPTQTVWAIGSMEWLAEQKKSR
jgi:hypothetical protein